jgi:hypothetical protein
MRFAGVQLTACQFHLPFYAGRPLPNTFALIGANLAYAFCLLLSDPSKSLSGSWLQARVLDARAGQLCLQSVCLVLNNVSFLQHGRAVALLALFTAVFRCDLLLLAAPLILGSCRSLLA